MTTEQQAVSSIASLVRIVAKHLDISQASLIDQVAHRIFADVFNGEPVGAAILTKGGGGGSMLRPHRCGPCADNREARAEIRDLISTPPAPLPVAGTCRSCGCTDADCSDCIRITGVACTWIEPDLCSACVMLMRENTDTAAI